MHTIINLKTFQEVDLARNTKEAMEKHLIELKKMYGESQTKDLVVMECA